MPGEMQKQSPDDVCGPRLNALETCSTVLDFIFQGVDTSAGH